MVAGVGAHTLLTCVRCDLRQQSDLPSDGEQKKRAKEKRRAGIDFAGPTGMIPPKTPSRRKIPRTCQRAARTTPRPRKSALPKVSLFSLPLFFAPGTPAVLLKVKQDPSEHAHKRKNQYNHKDCHQESDRRESSFISAVRARRCGSRYFLPALRAWDELWNIPNIYPFPVLVFDFHDRARRRLTTRRTALFIVSFF
jgi:hypothetical protein